MNNTVQVRRQQFCGKIGRYLINGPWTPFFLVRPANQTIAFLPNIPAFFRISNDWQFPLQLYYLIDPISYKVLMQHGYNRNINPHHIADFTAPSAGCIDNLFGNNLSFRCFKQPVTLICATNSCNSGISFNTSTHFARTSRHRLCGLTRIDMTVFRFINSPNQTISNLGQRMQIA